MWEGDGLRGVTGMAIQEVADCGPSAAVRRRETG